MIVESISILIIIMLILVIFVRERRYEYAKTAGILMILPGAYVLSFFSSLAIHRIFNNNSIVIILTGIVIGLIIAGMLIGLMAYHIKKPKLRAVYISTNGAFILIVGMIMLFDTVNRTF